jgi:hypothetical protein
VIADLEIAERAENEAATAAAKLRVEATSVRKQLAEKRAVLDDFRVAHPSHPNGGGSRALCAVVVHACMSNGGGSRALCAVVVHACMFEGGGKTTGSQCGGA